jgi:hypothetical protein
MDVQYPESDPEQYLNLKIYAILLNTKMFLFSIFKSSFFTVKSVFQSRYFCLEIANLAGADSTVEVFRVNKGTLQSVVVILQVKIVCTF